ncbi:zinc ribbon domain-containing protein [Bacillus paramycoides]|uniref:zinc ribbon domain-containing protein n=1 Tax=Bacillus paramycoides TaxID=2026194 RepID=UPI0015B79934|nr:zinc ribbon domain-containing protein [Bacillus paramycoides]NWK67720.1 zinc ribbon domain-containing protein [Bacillus paramycoides]
MRHCSNCGRKIQDYNNYCNGCGHYLEKVRKYDFVTEVDNKEQLPVKSKIAILWEKKLVKRGLLAFLIIMSSIVLIYMNSSPFNTMKGYWYTEKFHNYIQIREINDEYIEMVFYDKRRKEKVIQGNVVNHKRDTVNFYVTDRGKNVMATLELKDGMLYYFSPEDTSSGRMEFTKGTEEEFNNFYNIKDFYNSN